MRDDSDERYDYQKIVLTFLSINEKDVTFFFSCPSPSRISVSFTNWSKQPKYIREFPLLLVFFVQVTPESESVSSTEVTNQYFARASPT